MAAQLTVLQARRWWQRAGGLLVRAPLRPDQGLLLAPCNSIHTCFMGYAIDVVFLDRDARVLRIVPRVGAWRLVWHRPATQVLELCAGAAEQLGLRVGARLPS